MIKLGTFKTSLMISSLAALIFSSSANAILETSALFHPTLISRLIDSENLGDWQRGELDKISRGFECSPEFQTALRRLINRDMSAESQFNIIYALYTLELSRTEILQPENQPSKMRLTSEERLRLSKLQRFVDLCQQFSDLGYVSDQFSRLVDALSRVSPENLYHRQFVPTLKKLMSGTEDLRHIGDLTNALSDTNPKDWDHFSKLINLATQGMKNIRKFWTMGCLGRAPSESWDAVIATSQRLRNPEMDADDYSYVIAAATSLTGSQNWRNDQLIFEKTAKALGQKLDPKTTWHITDLATLFYRDRESIPCITDFATRTQGLLDFKDYHSLACIFSILYSLESSGRKRAFAHLLTENILAKKRVITDSDIDKLIEETSGVASKAADEGITDILQWVSLTKELEGIEGEITALNQQQIKHLAEAHNLEAKKRVSKGKTRRNFSKQASREHLIADGYHSDFKKAQKQKHRIEKQIKGLRKPQNDSDENN